MSERTDSIEGLHVLLGVTGGVAAYKAVDLAGKLTARGAAVDCVMTRNACRLVRPRSFQALTQRPVFTTLWGGPEQYRITHINLVEAADLIVVAPATANILAKAACGICDDLLSTTLCAAWNKPVLIAPAMNCNMWANPAVQRNVETLRAMEFQFVGPDTGRLACGAEGVGRMAEPADILAAIEAISRRIRKS